MHTHKQVCVYVNVGEGNITRNMREELIQIMKD